MEKRSHCSQSIWGSSQATPVHFRPTITLCGSDALPSGLPAPLPEEPPCFQGGSCTPAAELLFISLFPACRILGSLLSFRTPWLLHSKLAVFLLIQILVNPVGDFHLCHRGSLR